jgi:diguanylate cyclase (GGDEF)-like protein
MRTTRLRTRILLFFVALLGLVQAAAFLAVDSASEANVRAKLEHELTTGQRLFERMLEQDGERLAQAARVLAADFAFREAVASGDATTLASALENHGSRVAATATLFVRLDGSVQTDTLGLPQDRTFEVQELLAQARAEGRGTTIRAIGDTFYQLVAVPVRAPLPIGYVVLGFTIDDAMARELRELTDLDVSFVRLGPDGRWRRVASTLAPDTANVLPAALPSPAAATALRRLALAGNEYQLRVVPLAGALAGPAGDAAAGAPGGTAVLAAVLQRSFDDALAGFRRLRDTLVVLALVSLALSFAGGAAIARTITLPIDRLAGAARRMQDGDYATPVAAERQDEIGALAAGLDHMRRGIADREGEILRLAYRDALTGLPNRTLFRQQLERAVGARDGDACVSVLLFDLDRSKLVNESLGHDVGDHLLQAVGRRLEHALGADVLVARLGGDEFAVLATADDARARELATQIGATLEVPIPYDGQPIDVRASVGIATCPQHGMDADTLLRHADVAMYDAKRRHGGHASFDDVTQRGQAKHLSLLGELREALEHDQLRLAYQPKLSLADDVVKGVECLIRWVHPQRGLVSPAEFIPFAESTGYIRQVTQWTLGTAIARAAQWVSAGQPLQVAVNLSVRDLADRDLPRKVQALLDEHGLPAHWLSLEITESGFLEDPDGAQQVLQGLSDLGIRLAVDDYGTGYSSLSYLMRLPVKELKIDRSFVSGLHEDAGRRTIVRSTIEMGQALGLAIVAEGIESAAEVAVLRELGCDHVQGYHVCRPLFAPDLELWLGAGGYAPSAGATRSAASRTPAGAASAAPAGSGSAVA